MLAVFFVPQKCRGQFLFLSVFYLIFASEVFAKEIPAAVLKIPSRVQSLDWSFDSEFFSYTEGNIVTVRNGRTLERLEDIQRGSEKIQKIKFAKKASGENSELENASQLMLWTSDAEMIVYRLPGAKNPVSKKFSTQERAAPPIDFSQNGYYLAIGRADGGADCFFQLQLTQELFSFLAKAPLENDFTAIDFSGTTFSKEKIPQFKNEKNTQSPKDLSQIPGILEGGVAKIPKTPFPTPANSAKKFLPYKTSQTQKNVQTLSFSKNAVFLAALLQGKRICVWQITDTKAVSHFGDGEIINSSVAISDRGFVVYSAGKNKIRVANFLGECVLEIESLENVKEVCLSADENFAITLTDANRFHFYSLKDGEHVGYIPAWNASEISAFSFSADGKRVLIGHDDGSIYVLDLKDVFYFPDERPQTYRLFPVDGDASESYSYTPDAPSNSSGENRGQKERAKSISPEPTKKAAHNLEFRTEYATLKSDYYKFALKPNIGYINGSLLGPVYFGALVKMPLCFQSDDFPLEYRYSGPNFGGVHFAFPIGITFGPKEKDLYFFAEAQFGAAIYRFWNPFSEEYDFHPSFATSLYIGMAVRFLHFYLGADWDKWCDFSFVGGIGFEYRFKKQRTNSK